VKYAYLMVLGLVGAFLYLGGAYRKNGKVLLVGLACLDLQFGIIAVILFYARSWMLASAFSFAALYMLFGFIRPAKKT